MLHVQNKESGSALFVISCSEHLSGIRGSSVVFVNSGMGEAGMESIGPSYVLLPPGSCSRHMNAMATQNLNLASHSTFRTCIFAQGKDTLYVRLCAFCDTVHLCGG